MPTTTLADARHEVRVEDVEYQRQGGTAMLARVYRPSGTGPFPAALQVHGGLGMTDDSPLAVMYRMARGARIYDGADEVHKMVVARRILRAFEGGGTWRFT